MFIHTFCLYMGGMERVKHYTRIKLSFCAKICSYSYCHNYCADIIVFHANQDINHFILCILLLQLIQLWN